LKQVTFAEIISSMQWAFGRTQSPSLGGV